MAFIWGLEEYKLMDWFLSAMSMLLLWMMGNKNKYAPIFGIVIQVFWAIYSISLKQYGLLVGTFGYFIIHIRNTYKWFKDEKQINC